MVIITLINLLMLMLLNIPKILFWLEVLVLVLTRLGIYMVMMEVDVEEMAFIMLEEEIVVFATMIILLENIVNNAQMLLYAKIAMLSLI